MRSTTSPTVLVALGLAAFVSLLVLACGGSSAPMAFAELQRVADIKQGQPVLVFVYTDG